MDEVSYKGWTRPGPRPPAGPGPEPGETLDHWCGHFRIFQYEKGHRCSTDDLLAGIVVLFALQTAANLQFWRRSDEFLRTQLLLVSATTFAIGQGALYLWAAAERLGLVAPISGWATIVLTMTAYLGTGLYFGIRNMPGSGRA